MGIKNWFKKEQKIAEVKETEIVTAVTESVQAKYSDEEIDAISKLIKVKYDHKSEMIRKIIADMNKYNIAIIKEKNPDFEMSIISKEQDEDPNKVLLPGDDEEKG